jgi:hypothetical protein
MIEGKLNDAVTRAKEAKLLLESPLLQECFDKLESSYLSFWRNSKVEDADGREKIFLAIQVLEKVRNQLKHIIAGGSLAQHELDYLAQKRERKTAAPL